MSVVMISKEGLEERTQSKSRGRNGQKWINMALIRGTMLYYQRCVE
jgi:hypothetical protein